MLRGAAALEDTAARNTTAPVATFAQWQLSGTTIVSAMWTLVVSMRERTGLADSEAGMAR